MTTDQPHMSWCQGQHYEYGGDCQLTRHAAALEIALLGIPCDSVRLAVEVDVTSVGYLDAVLAAIGELRPLLAASEEENDCTRHQHATAALTRSDLDPDDEYRCDRCGTTTAPRLLQLDDPATWWCDPCCATHQVRIAL